MPDDEPMTGMERGLLVEIFIGEFSSSFLMRDFVYMNVTFISGGQLKCHPADLLFVLGDECIVVSVKGTDGRPKSEEKLALWLTKKTRDGSQAAKVGIQRLQIPFSAENFRGERREFAAGSLKPRCGLCVLECSQEPFAPIDFDISQPNSPLPIHVISANDLLNTALWLGSIWDLFQYFDKRALILSTFTGINSERFPLAYYRLVANEFSGYAAVDKQELGARFQLHMLDNLGKYSDRDRYSNYINAIVQELHARHPEMESFVPPEFLKDVEPSNQRTGWREMAAMLNGLPSSNKAYVGKRIHEIYVVLKGTGQCGCIAHKRLYEKTVFVFCGFSDMVRTERIRNLCRLVDAARVKYGVSEALGVAFDADCEFTGFDVRWVGGPLLATPELQELGEKVFGTDSGPLSADPFGKARPYTPPEDSGKNR
jgi:hypothetical protein